MRSHLPLVLLASVALLATAGSGHAQTYEDYASGAAYVTTSPVGSAATTRPAQGTTYQDYASGRAYAPTGSAGLRSRDDSRLYATPIPSYAWARLGIIPDWPQPAPSITSTVARSRFLPSAGMRLGTSPQRPGTSVTETLARSRFTPSAGTTQFSTPTMLSRTPGAPFYNGR